MTRPKRTLDERRSSVFRRPSDSAGRSRRERLTLYEPLAELPSEEAPAEEPGGVKEAAERSRAAIYRLLDIIVAAGALVLLSPLLVLIAVAIRLESEGPILYRQLRVGFDGRGEEDRRAADDEDEPPSEIGDRRSDMDRRGTDIGGRPFFIYKFRTMHVDAESETGPIWSNGQDRRTTRIGKFLREHRLDEIPQFWNVLKGDMSVVGPRPERPVFFQKLRREIRDYPVRQKVRPGITGWAQVNRGYDQCVDDVHRKLIYDLEYIRRRSLWFDLRIMFETILVMWGRQKPFSDLDEGNA